MDMLQKPQRCSTVFLMNVGYARVSTEEQNLDMQCRSLRAAGCELVLEDCGVSGAARSRPQLDKAFASLRQGDILVVWKLDRLGRSLSHLIEVVQTLGERGVDSSRCRKRSIPRRREADSCFT